MEFFEFIKNYAETFPILLMVLVSVLAFVIMINQYRVNNKISMLNKEEMDKEIEEIKKLASEDKLNAIELTLRNISELRQYYRISVNQANHTFFATLTISILGFAMYVIGIIFVTLANRDAVIISLISGTVVEIIAGLFFWLHSQSLNQLNLYHQRLSYSEKYLIVLEIIDLIPAEKKYEEYKNLINYILNDNQLIIKQTEKVLGNKNPDNKEMKNKSVDIKVNNEDKKQNKELEKNENTNLKIEEDDKNDLQNGKKL